MISFRKNGFAFSMLLMLAGYMLPAQVRLPKVLGDNMVLQRDKPVQLWGWAARGAAVTVKFNGQEGKATADGKGRWKLALKPMSFGGPYDMTIADKAGQVTLRNILIGDVWVCSGQSNMEMPIQGWGGDSTRNAGREIKAANYPNIRLFTVERATSFMPEDDVKSGSWQLCSPATVASFSAVAYYFGRKLTTDLNIPIGLVHTSWGGTNVQAWTSWDEMGKEDPYKSMSLKDMPAKQKNWAKNREAYTAALANDPGVKGTWYAVGTDISTWKKTPLPQMFEQSAIGNADGIVWYRKDFEVDGNAAAKEATLSLGAIDDNEETYLNGTLIGKTNSYNTKRVYTIPAGVLQAGKNTLVVRVTDTGGGGGFYGEAKELYVATNGGRVALAGDWLYKPAVVTTQFNIEDMGPNSFPSQLYNAMVAPLIMFPIKGVIWYQGEANTYEALKYRAMFPAMIRDWRAKWGYEFPFFWVQLANFLPAAEQPVESNWAMLREAQHMALGLPQTGEALAIDIGEAKDIHPKNKQDVGYRLALAALKVAYGKDIVYSGPVFSNLTVNGDKAVLSFTQTGGGLVARGDRYGYLRGFAVAGADGKFVWAKAWIENNRVIVSSDAVKNPVSVRYAWADNPDDANLYNAEGLPASPFRTDKDTLK